MTTYTCPVETFLKDVSSHTMTVLRDDGVNRHLRFRKPRPAGSEYWFDLITWPGALCIDGDMGTYVFKRLDDMFEFFRTDREYLERNGAKLAINPGYWDEKVQAHPGKGLKEFDEERFDAAIRERLVEWMRSNRDRTTKDERRELWDRVMDEVIGADGAERKRMAAYDFHHDIKRGSDFYFQDFWETNVERFTFHFIWCCYAIALGIKMYDENKSAVSGARLEVTS